MSDDNRLGTVVKHRRYVPYSHAHYAGNLVDGAYTLGLFGDVATEACIQTDGTGRRLTARSRRRRCTACRPRTG